jgi:hypothetical protein
VGGRAGDGIKLFALELSLNPFQHERETEETQTLVNNLENKNQLVKYSFLSYTFALGFKDDFSEDSEPTDELGDKPGPEDPATPLTESDPDDAPCESIYFVAPLAWRYAKSSVEPPGDLVFS